MTFWVRLVGMVSLVGVVKGNVRSHNIWRLVGNRFVGIQWRLTPCLSFFWVIWSIILLDTFGNVFSCAYWVIVCNFC